MCLRCSRRFHQDNGCAVLVVTHDARLSQTCDRTITLVDGAIVSDERRRPGDSDR